MKKTHCIGMVLSITMMVLGVIPSHAFFQDESIKGGSVKNHPAQSRANVSDTVQRHRNSLFSFYSTREFRPRNTFEENITNVDNLTTYEVNFLIDLYRGGVITKDDVNIQTKMVEFDGKRQPISRLTIRNEDPKFDGLLNQHRGAFQINGSLPFVDKPEDLEAKGKGRDVPIKTMIPFILPDGWTTDIQGLPPQRVTSWDPDYPWIHLLHRMSVEEELSITVDIYEKTVTVQPADHSPYYLYKGEQFSEALDRWSRRNNWQSVWDAPTDYMIPVRSTVNGDMLSVIDSMNESFEKNDVPIHLKPYENNIIRAIERP